MTREERIKRLMVGIYRARGSVRYLAEMNASDAEVLGTYGDQARPEAVAMLDVLEDLVRERKAEMG